MRIITFLLLLIIASNARAWHDEKTTHLLLSEYVADHYFNPELNKSSVNGNTFKYWILLGSDLEDQGDFIEFATGKARSLNHFHAPTKPLSEAGLSDLPTLPPNGESTLKWAQDSDYQTTKVGGDWSWKMIRNLYYNFLTTSDNTAREVWQSKYLKGLGYQIHLIQDMSQPNHVRNDTHILDGWGKKVKYGFETWAVNNESKIRNILDTTPIPTVTVNLLPKLTEDTSLAPVARLFDTRDNLSGGVINPSAAMDRGLAEFTNTNFFSEDTTFADGLSTSNKQYFPYPRKAETNLQNFIDNNLDVSTATDADGVSVANFIINKQNTSGVPLDCLAKPGINTKKYYAEFGEGSAFYKSFVVDEGCFEEYARHLFPRAVAYSKTMLDYFFRGNIELSFSESSSASPNFIRLKGRNAGKKPDGTPTDEEMRNPDKINLVITYKVFKKDPTQGMLVPDGSDDHYITAPLSNTVSAIPKDAPVDLEFDLSANPIPLFAYDISLQVVFKGELGAESGAVAVGRIDLPGVGADIHLERPDKGVYAITTHDGVFTDFRVKASNTSANAMPDGDIKLLLMYRRAAADPFTGVATDTIPESPNYFYSEASVSNGVRSIAQSATNELVFTLSTPLPIWATNVYATLIYIGQIGSQMNKIAYGFLDIAEPTPIDIVNNMDRICIKTDPNPAITTGSYLAAGSQEAIDAVGVGFGGRPNQDIYSHRMKDLYLTFTADTATASNYSVRFPVIEPGHYGRIFVLADYTFTMSRNVTIENIYGPLQDVWALNYVPQTESVNGVTNQPRLINGEYADWYPAIITERGIRSWWLRYFENIAWPAGTTCDRTVAPAITTAPVAVEIMP